ncbi:RTC4-like domain-containing protein [Cokeromyces recurvatus]|uniref:RTC4-like domain-containing protein n=1 Tax=Cokeromyces recurvatus TaxID=90255 RepID=UPI00221EBB43|nr:RTC4-like domain-containing protein [Cokeromyces recurvatus]KAI7898068.1 RTC4-like domain-containing protein [Cokeromyces recurvatus]
MHKNTYTFSRYSIKNKYEEPVDSNRETSLLPPPRSNTVYIPSNPHRLKRDTINNKRKHDDDDDDNDFQKDSLIRFSKHSNDILVPRYKRINFKETRKDSIISEDTLNLPEKRRRTATRYTETESTLLDNFKRAQRVQREEEEKPQCPYCSEFLFPMTDAIEHALKVIKTKDKAYEERHHVTTSFKGHATTLRPVSSMEKDAFCRLHKLELVIKPQGAKEQYPCTIRFHELPERIVKYDKELRQIIKNKIPSHYRQIAEGAYLKLGENKARGTMGMMHHFEASLPGYYGPRGASVILETLSKMYLEDSDVLKTQLKSPQLPMEFLQQVLVPEVGVRLIRDDLFKKYGVKPEMTRRAQEIIEESREYGNAMFPVENQDIQDNNKKAINSDSSITINLSNNNEEEEE